MKSETQNPLTDFNGQLMIMAGSSGFNSRLLHFINFTTNFRKSLDKCVQNSTITEQAIREINQVLNKCQL